MISREEMQVSEQTITAQNILLNKLKNYTMMEEQPLVYHYLNTYELGDELELQEDQSKVINQMVQAVLLNAVRTSVNVRLSLSVKHSTITATLPEPYPS